MNPYEVILGIVVVVMIARMLRDHRRARESTPPGSLSDPDVARMAEDLARLRERVQVLERVVTDDHGSAELDRRIDRLRDR